MRKQEIKKIYVFGAVVMFLVLGMMGPVSSQNYETIIIETKPIGSRVSEKIELSISKDEFEDFTYEFNQLLKQNLSEQELTGKALDLFRKYGILPESATLTNLEKSANYIRNSIVKKRLSQQKSPRVGGISRASITINDVIVGLGCTFILATFMNAIAPFAWPPDSVWKLFDEDYYIPFLDREITIGAIGTVGFSSFDLLVSQSISFGWVHSMIPLKNTIFLEPFYGILIFPAGFSLTIYQKSNPPITLFDCIVGACLVGNFITFNTSWD